MLSSERRRAPPDAGQLRPARGVPVGGMRGGVRAVHVGLRGDGGGDAGRASRGFPTPASCEELQADAGEMLQPVAVQMFRVLVNTEGAAQAGAMFPGGDDGGDGSSGHPLDPLLPLAPVPPPLPDATEGADEAAGVTQYHAVCTSADVASCVPACNAEHHGYELLATIDGTDTKFSCNLAHGLYSWMGAASEGGYLGADSASFFSAVVSGAAGSYIVTLRLDAGISTDLVIRPGQDVHISGGPGLAAAPSWGSGSCNDRGSCRSQGSFSVQETGSLALRNIRLLAGVFTYGDAIVSMVGCVLEQSAGCTFAGGAISMQSSTVISDVSVSGGSVSLIRGCTLSASVTTTNSGTLSLSSMVVPVVVLTATQGRLSGAGSRLRLSAVTVLEHRDWGGLTGTVAVGEDGLSTVDPPKFGTDVPSIFLVVAGPCEVSEGGRCVGRPEGYLGSESCAIAAGVAGCWVRAQCLTRRAATTSSRCRTARGTATQTVRRAWRWRPGMP